MQTGSRLWQWSIKTTIQDKHPHVAQKKKKFFSWIQQTQNTFFMWRPAKCIILRGRGDNNLSLLPPVQSLEQGCSWGRCFIAFSLKKKWDTTHLLNCLCNTKQAPQQSAATSKLYLQYLSLILERHHLNTNGYDDDWPFFIVKLLYNSHLQQYSVPFKKWCPPKIKHSLLLRFHSENF